MSESNSTKPCKTCGVPKPLDGFHKNRLTKDGRQSNCKECVSAYNALYRAANAEQLSEYNKRWRMENAEEYNRKRKEQYAADPAPAIERSKAYRQANPGRALDAQRRSKRAWRKKNPEKAQAENARRRARRKAAEGSYSGDELRQMYDDQQGLCAYCETPLFGTYDVDHMIPLSRGGANGWQNLAVACRRCNRQKHAKTAEEFMQAKK